MKSIKKLFFAVTLVSLILFGCSGENASKDNAGSNGDVLDIEFSTATTTGNFYPLGVALANVWNENIDEVNISAQASDGSVQNINLMQEGDIKLALSTLGVLYNAYHGKDQFEGREFKDFRIVSTLFSDAAQFIVTENSGVESVEDLVGQPFVPGAPGSGAKDLTEKIFEGYDMTLEDVQAEYVGYTQAADLLRDGKVIGAQVMSALPTSAAIEMLSTTNSKMISLTDEAVQKITDANDWLVEFTIPSDMYEELDADIKTVAQPSVIFVSKDMSDEIVYELTKTMWENLEGLHNTVAATKTMEIQNAASDIADLPLHPGAEKYYEEMDVLE